MQFQMKILHIKKISITWIMQLKMANTANQYLMYTP